MNFSEIVRQEQQKQEEKTEERICEKHGEYTVRWARSFGEKEFDWYGHCEECEYEDRIKRHEEVCDEDRQKEINRNTEKMEIPLRYKDKDFDNYEAKTEKQKSALFVIRAFVENFETMEKKGCGLVLIGKPGTGKTHLAIAAGKYVIQNKYQTHYYKDVCRIKGEQREIIYQSHCADTALYSSFPEIMRRIKNSWDKSSEESEGRILGSLEKLSLLIIDEIGVQFGSETEKNYLFEIINGRYELMKPTIIVSNLNLKDLATYMGQRVIDRLTEGGGAIVSFDWESYRSKIK